MSGTLWSLFPTWRPAFENVPLVAGGWYEDTTAESPPFTTTSEMACVDDHAPPDAVPLVMVTTCSLPSGSSNA